MSVNNKINHIKKLDKKKGKIKRRKLFHHTSGNMKLQVFPSHTNQTVMKT